MTFNKYSLIVASGLLLALASCGDSKHANAGAELIDDNASSVSLSISGSAENVRTLGKASNEFFIKVNSDDAWQLRLEPASASEWISLESSSGNIALQKGIAVKLSENAKEQREAKIILASKGQTKEILVVQQGVVAPVVLTPAPEGSKVEIPAGEHIHGEYHLPEVPRLMGGSNMYFVTYKTADGRVNYSLEYDVYKRHSRWVAYSWTKETSKDAISGRNDQFRWDNIIPVQYSTDNWFRGSGFSRGHLVANNDRQYDREANSQTFYYANMSPQRQNHNEGVWLQLEQLLQGWARNGSLKYDAIYVTKGGTIADDQVESKRLKDIIVVPKYYWMAVVLKNGNDYHGIGFWTEHLKPSRVNSISSVAKSIDEIEKLTGIDLFPNLENDVEFRVEAEKPTDYRWPSI